MSLFRVMGLMIIMVKSDEDDNKNQQIFICLASIGVALFWNKLAVHAPLKLL